MLWQLFQLVVAYLLRGIAAPCDMLLHQCVTQLLKWHLEGKRNWISEVIAWVQEWDRRFGLRLVPGGSGWTSVCFVWTPWIETAPQRQWKFPGRWGFHPQVWHTTDFTSDDAWRTEWRALVLWGKRVSERFAAAQKQRFFLQQQRDRLASQGPFGKGRVLL